MSSIDTDECCVCPPTKPVEDPSILEFVVRRFMRSLRHSIALAMEEEIPVALTTHTDYYDLDQKTFVTTPIIDENAESVVPAIGLTNLDFTPNWEDYRAGFRYTPAQAFDDDGMIFTGVRKSNPPEVYDLSIDLRLFHNRQTKLLRLIRSVQRYFRSQPYLFVPTDTDLVDGNVDADLCDLHARYFRGEDISDYGHFLEQGLERDQGFSNTSVSNSDNLFASEASAMIRQIVLPDNLDLGFFGELTSAGIVIFDKTDPLEPVLATIDVTSEEP